MSADPTDEQCIHAALMQLVAVGTILLDAIATKAKAGADLVELTPQYDAIGRGLRKTALLLDHRARPAEVATPDADRVGARKRVVRDVEDAIHRRAGPADAEALRAELADRLDSLDLEHDIRSRPVQEIVRDICRDFGLFGTPGQFPRRTPQDVQDLFDRAATAAKSAPHAPSPPPNTAPEPPAPARTDPIPPPLTPPPPASRPPEAADSLLHYLTRSRGT